MASFTTATNNKAVFDFCVMTTTGSLRVSGMYFLFAVRKRSRLLAPVEDQRWVSALLGRRWPPHKDGGPSVGMG